MLWYAIIMVCSMKPECVTVELDPSTPPHWKSESDCHAGIVEQVGFIAKEIGFVGPIKYHYRCFLEETTKGKGA